MDALGGIFQKINQRGDVESGLGSIMESEQKLTN